MRADLDRENAVNRQIVAGHKDKADQIQFEAEVEKKAVDISKALNVNMDEARQIARENLALDVQAHDVQNASKQAKKDGAAASRDALAATKSEAEYTRQIEQSRLKNIQGFGQRVEEDPFLSVDSKAKFQMQVYAQEQQQLQRIIMLEHQRILLTQGNKNPGLAAELRKDTKGIEDAANRLANVTQKMRAMTFSGTMQKGLTSWVNQFGTTAEAAASIVTNTLGHAVDGISNSISGLVLGTMTWKQAFSQAASSVIQDIIRIVVQQTIGRAVMSAVNAAFGSEDAATSSSFAASASAAWSSAAILASIATYGTAAGAGLSAVLIAVGTGEGALAGMQAGSSAAGFQGGGYTGDGAANEVAGAVHRKEVVWNAQDVDAHGGWRAVDRLRTLRVGTASASRATAGVGPASGSERGGRSAAVGRGATHIHLAAVNTQSEAERYLSSAKGERHLVKLQHKNRQRAGIKV